MSSGGNMIIAKRYILAAVVCFAAVAVSLWAAEAADVLAIKLVSMLAFFVGIIFTVAIFTADRPRVDSADDEWFSAIK